MQADHQTQGSLFEGLFVRALGAQGAFKSELRANGYDIDRPEPAYPAAVFNACLRVAHRHCYPDVDAASAFRALGVRFTNGFLETIVGRVVGVGLPLLGPERFLRKFPTLARMDSSPVQVTVEPAGERAMRLTFRDDPHLNPDFVAGILEGGLRVTKVEPTVNVEKVVANGCDIVCRW